VGGGGGGGGDKVRGIWGKTGERNVLIVLRYFDTNAGRGGETGRERGRRRRRLRERYEVG